MIDTWLWDYRDARDPRYGYMPSFMDRDNDKEEARAFHSFNDFNRLTVSGKQKQIGVRGLGLIVG